MATTLSVNAPPTARVAPVGWLRRIGRESLTVKVAGLLVTLPQAVDTTTSYTPALATERLLIASVVPETAKVAAWAAKGASNAAARNHRAAAKLPTHRDAPGLLAGASWAESWL